MPAGLGKLWPSLTGLSHTNDCMTQCAVCSDSQTSSWRRDKYLFEVFPIVRGPGPFCLCSILSESVGCKCQVKCRSNKIPRQHVMRFVWYQMVFFVPCFVPQAIILWKEWFGATLMTSLLDALQPTKPGLAELCHYFTLLKDSAKGNIWEYFHFVFTRALNQGTKHCHCCLISATNTFSVLKEELLNVMLEDC